MSGPYLILLISNATVKVMHYKTPTFIIYKRRVTTAAKQFNLNTQVKH